MRVLVCVKRVPAPGAKINVSPDGQEVDTANLGFTMSPHEECGVELAVQLVGQHGGESHVLTLGVAEADIDVYVKADAIAYMEWRRRTEFLAALDAIDGTHHALVEEEMRVEVLYR